MARQPLHHATIMLCAVLLAWLGWQGVSAMRRPSSPSAIVPRPLEYRVNVNSADLVDLTLLPGIGPATAQRVIDYRAAHGPFSAPAQLERVKMIGPVTRGKIEPWIEFGSAVAVEGVSDGAGETGGAARAKPR